jgi:hypothetical protein
MLTRRLAALAVLALACHESNDLGFEIVRVPLSAYATADGGRPDAAAAQVTKDAGADPLVLCIPRSEADSKDDEEESSDCPSEYPGRHYDEKATTRHRSKGDDSTVCCYRKGRAPTPRDDE